MKNIKKLLFKHIRKTSIIIIICTSLSILSLIAIEYANNPNSDKSFLILSITMILAIQTITIYATNYSLKRTYKTLKKHIEDNSLSYDENFEKIATFVYASKDVLLYNNISSKCSVHLKMVEKYRKEIKRQGVNDFAAIIFSLKEGLKEQFILFYTEEDYQKVVRYLSSKNIPNTIDENEFAEKSDTKKRIRQPKVAIYAIFSIILISLLFSMGYYFIDKNFQIKEPQINDKQKKDDKYLEVVKLSEDLIVVESDYIDDVEIVYIINNSDHLLSVDITLSNGSEFENIGVKYVRPYGVEVHVIEYAFEANKYEVEEFEFYKSSNDSSIDYEAYYSEKERGSYNISLYNNMRIENVKEILNEEKDYIKHSDYQIQKYYFHDMDINSLANEYPSEGSHKYLGIVNNYNKEIEIYENVNDKDVLLETIKY